jgi:hypothetical protein
VQCERIFPYLGGEEVNNSPTHAHHRWCIDFNDFPLQRDAGLQSWFLNEGSEACDKRRKEWRRVGIVPGDYPGPVAADWPDLLEIVERLVKPERNPQKRDALRNRWWQYAEKRPGLRAAAVSLEHVLVVAQTSPHTSIARIEVGQIVGHTAIVFATSAFALFGTLQSRVHDVWTRAFAASMKDDQRYLPSDCFSTFSLPSQTTGLMALGEAYLTHRASLMVARNHGLTKTYNRFHDAQDKSPDIVRLRELHHELDLAVLGAYGWNDLAAGAVPEFLTEATEAEHRYQGRLFWPAAFREEVLARLLDLNRARAEEERHLGLTRYRQDADDDVDESAE